MVAVNGGFPRNIGRSATSAAAVPTVDAAQPERDIALYELDDGDFKFVPLTDRGREFCDEINEAEDCERLVYPRSLEWLAVGMYRRRLQFRMMYPYVNYSNSLPPPRVGPSRDAGRA